jgi:hypothetical protein
LSARDTSKGNSSAIQNPKEARDPATSGTKTANPEKVATQGGGGASTPAKEPAAKPAEGTISVYFLGGVGEFFVNGKRFSQQPPFDGVSIAAGTYRMACRMSGDAAPKEFTVTIRANRETVIEYELGREPVVAEE